MHRVGEAQVAPRLVDLLAQGLRHGEVLEQRHQIGEGLVKGRRIGMARLLPIGMQPIQQRMRRLMRHDIVGKTAEDPAAAHHRPGILRIGAEIAEQQGNAIGAVIGILAA